MTGRRPKPTSLKIVAGNPGRRPLPKNEPKPEAEIPEPPPFLHGEALQEWHRLTDEFSKVGMMTRIDRDALGIYCQMFARWGEAQEKIRQKGLVVSEGDKERMNPYVNISLKTEQQMRQYLIEFGMTPASRSKVVCRSEEKKAHNPWDDL